MQPPPNFMFGSYRMQEPPADDGEGDGREREPIGQEPEESVTDQFLRQQALLLKPGDWQYDVGFIYNWQEATTPVVVPPGVVAQRRLRRRDWVAPLSVRYGLSDRVEMFGSLPIGISHLELSDISGGHDTSTAGIGDLTIGFLYEIKRRRDHWPELTASIRATAPTGKASINPSGNDAALGNGFWSVALALNFVQMYDPLVTFGSVGYRHDFREDFLGLWFQPGERLTYSYGLGFAVNDDISIVSEFFGEFQGQLKVNGQYVPSSSAEPMGLRFSLVRRITPVTRIQPFVTFGLNDDASDVSVGVLYTGDLKQDRSQEAKKP